jgi:hypothetical protein
MKKNYLSLMVVVALTLTACGGGNKSNSAEVESEGLQTDETVEAEPTKAAVDKTEQKAEAKKWYEGDFTLTEKMYVGSASMTRTYARKGNIVIGTADGSPTTSLFVCTDSTRTQYLVGNEKKTYAKTGEKSGFTSVDDAICKYLKSQMSNTLFGNAFKPSDEGCTAKDTTIFGRSAYVITKETTASNVAASVSGKGIMHVDKENGLVYYKYAMMKSGDKVIREGVEFEVTAFSDQPTYEGLIVSLDGLTEITK